MSARLQQAFAQRLASGGRLFVAYIGAGCPDPEASVEVALLLAEMGVDAIEFGMPFSDPYGDGAVNQAAAERGIAMGTGFDTYFRLASRIRSASEVPLILFGYANPLFRRGIATSLDYARTAGLDGLLVVDLPVEEAEETAVLCRQSRLVHVFLSTPVSTEARLERIGDLATGFVYHVSRAGVTGERDQMPPDLEREVGRVRARVRVPVVVGFGLSRPEHVREACRVADGAVVGSAIVRRTLEHHRGPGLLNAIRELVAPLLQSAREGF